MKTTEVPDVCNVIRMECVLRGKRKQRMPKSVRISSEAGEEIRGWMGGLAAGTVCRIDGVSVIPDPAIPRGQFVFEDE